MSIPGSLTPLFSTGSSAGGYQIERSLRFNSADSAYLSRTPAVAGNRRTWTWAGWVKRSVLSVSQQLFNSDGGITDITFGQIVFLTNDRLRVAAYNLDWRDTSAVFRDVSAWYHIVVAFDTTQTTASNRVKIYVNGVQLTDFATTNDPSLNTDYAINQVAAHNIGRTYSSYSYFSGCLADIHFIDGQALTPSSFTEVSATTGQLIPKAYAGTYTGNSFWLKFNDNSAATATTLGKDSFLLGNNWTPNNLSTTTGGPTSVAAASGALPVYNTTDTYGTVKGTGTRTDTNSASIILAIPMDGTNNGTTFTDESATIKGSGSAKSITRNGAVTSTTQSKFYGSSGFFDGTDDYLTTPDDNDFTLGSGDFTIEFFINPSATASKGLFGIIGSGGSTASTAFCAQLTSTNTLFFSAGDGSGETSFTSTAVFTAGTWNHGAIVRNGNTVNFYFSGGLDKSISFTRVVANQSTPFTLGRLGDYVGAGYYNGYIQDFRIYKGVAKYTSNFNPPSSTANATVAAGNDSLVDTPTSTGTDTGVGGEVRGNYATLNNLKSSYTGGTVTVSNGNLDFSANMSANQIALPATIGVSSGKWYWEITCNSITKQYGFDGAVGISSNGDIDNGTSAPSGVRFYVDDGLFYNGASSAAYGASWQAGDIIGVALNLDAGTLSFYKNNSSQGQATSSLTGTWFPVVASNNVVSFTANFGQRAFAYTAPSGFKALCDTNLPAPLTAKPNTLMDVALYTGNGGTQTISGLAFEPDLVWFKSRNNTYAHALVDVLRGGNKVLYSNATDADVTMTGGISAWNNDGFTAVVDTTYANSINTSSSTVVAWCWKAIGNDGTASTTNPDGSIISQVRANVSAGFSVVTYTGTGSAGATVGHGLGVSPEFMIFKRRNDGTLNWRVYHKDIGNTKVIFLSLTNAASADSTFLNNTTPSSTVFTIGTDTGVNGSGGTVVAYCFAPVVGYSSFGSYTGNGSTDGPFIFTSFRPRWVMVKCSSASGFRWVVWDSARDPYNLTTTSLAPNLSDSEITGFDIDIVSNGFKLRDSENTLNQSGATYIYAAFAENPFQYARAR